MFDRHHPSSVCLAGTSINTLHNHLSQYSYLKLIVSTVMKTIIRLQERTCPLTIYDKKYSTSSQLVYSQLKVKINRVTVTILYYVLAGIWAPDVIKRLGLLLPCKIMGRRSNDER
jgi:hypothetical protein